LGQSLRRSARAAKGERNCKIKGHHLETWSQGHYDWWKNWYLLVCCGCDHVFAEARSSDSESRYPVGYDEEGDVEYELDVTTKSWPAKFKRNRPEWLDRLNGYIEHERSEDLESCLFQVYEALDHDLNILAAIGIRTTFDVASEILGVDPDRPFEEKLKAMEELSIISPTQRDDFDVLINAGNASAHRGWNPNFEDLDPLVDSLDHFIADKFVTPHLRRKPRTASPGRGRKCHLAQRKAERRGRLESQRPPPERRTPKVRTSARLGDEPFGVRNSERVGPCDCELADRWHLVHTTRLTLPAAAPARPPRARVRSP
jgi:hypothetical protein